MIKKLATAAVGTVLLGTTLAAALPLAADASSNQRICSSRNSTADIYVYSKSGLGDGWQLDARDCVTLPKGDAVVYMLSSYRVGYGGDYSNCRLNSGFTPWTKADRVYFRSYPGDNC